MKFAYIDQYRGCLSQDDLCGFFGVTSRGLRAWRSRGLSDYINGFYNPRRRHSANGGKSPLAFERLVA